MELLMLVLVLVCFIAIVMAFVTLVIGVGDNLGLFFGSVLIAVGTFFGAKGVYEADHNKFLNNPKETIELGVVRGISENSLTIDDTEFTFDDEVMKDNPIIPSDYKIGYFVKYTRVETDLFKTIKDVEIVEGE